MERKCNCAVLECVLGLSAICPDVPTRDGARMGFVMPFLDNGSVQSFLLQPDDLRIRPFLSDYRSVLYMLLDVAAALEHLHGLSTPVLHRDLATRNVFVGWDDDDQRYRFMIGDWGRA